MTTFFERHPGITGDKKHYAMALIAAGASEEHILESIGMSKLEAGRTIDLACPRCGGLMSKVSLLNDRQATYCPQDRVCIPIPVK